MKRRGPRTKWQRIIRETVLEILIGAAIGLAFDAMRTAGEVNSIADLMVTQM